MYVCIDGQAGWRCSASADPVKTIDARGDPDAPRRVDPTGHAHRRQSRPPREAVARQLGIDEVVADVLPEQKADVVRGLQACRAACVAMAGDGVNDAPALAAGRMSASPWATGTDVAMQSAGVTLLSGDLTRHRPSARRLSRATMRNIRQNLFFAFAYNALGDPDRRRGALSGLRSTAQPDDRQRAR